MQAQLDVACGNAANCTAIQPGQSCYNPNNVNDHASFAFSWIYQQQPLPSNCHFGGWAKISTQCPVHVGDSCAFPTVASTPVAPALPVPPVDPVELVPAKYLYVAVAVSVISLTISIGFALSVYVNYINCGSDNRIELHV